MSLISDTRTALGITSESRDAELVMLIDAAKEHMMTLGLLDGSEDDSEIVGQRRQAIVVYCKANFGFDNADAERFTKSYESILRYLSVLRSAGNDE